MRKILFFFVSLVSITVFAQNRQLDFEATLPDSVKYYVPVFTSGRVVYKDGGYSSGKLNISMVDQTVRFIDENGIHSLSNVDLVDRVVIGPYLFLKNGSEFVALVDIFGETSLGVTRKFVFERDKKKGAFGAISATTNISSVSSASTERGMVYDFSRDVEYRIETKPYLYRKNRFYPVTRKYLIKCFPDRKEQINSYLDTHSVNLDSVEDVENLMKAIF